MTYELFFNSVRGSSHIKKDIPCEDFGIKVDCGEFKIFATADGHGDPNCLRSNIGSRLVCEIAVKNLESFARTIKEEGWEDKLLDEHESIELAERLIASIVGSWSEAVNDELQEHPLTPEELSQASVYGEEYLKGIRIERMYGTTLIAGLQTEKYLLLLQQGDGRCVVFNSDGSASQPIPWDDRCFGTATTSLCDHDAAQSCRYHIIDLEENPIIACIAGSDGVEDSFPSSMEKTHSYYRALLRYACENGVPALEEYLADELSALSVRGSADDVTVSGIVDIERVKPFLDSFTHLNRVVDCEDEVAIWVNKVKSIEDGGKLEFLTKKYSSAMEAYNNAAEKQKRLEIICSELLDKLVAVGLEVPQNTADYDSSEDTDASADTDIVTKGIHIAESIAERMKQIFTQRDSKELIDEYYRKSKELETAYEELRTAEKNKASAEGEYFPYIERYENTKKTRDEAIRKLEILKSLIS